MGFLANRTKKRALKSYVRVLPRLLKKRYGKHKRYTDAQVRATIGHAGLDDTYIDYALAMYVSKSDFKAATEREDADATYDALRLEIAEKFFEGRTNFTTNQALQMATQWSFFGFANDHDAPSPDGFHSADDGD